MLCKFIIHRKCNNFEYIFPREGQKSVVNSRTCEEMSCSSGGQRLVTLILYDVSLDVKLIAHRGQVCGGSCNKK